MVTNLPAMQAIFDPWVRKMPWRRKQQPTPVFLPEKSHGQRILGGCKSKGSQRVGHDWVIKHTYIYTNLYISSSSLSIHVLMDSCYRILTIVNNGTVHIGRTYFFGLVFFVVFGYFLRSGIARSHGCSLFFWGTSRLFSMVAAPVYIPPNSVKGFSFLHNLFNIYYL